ncbi:ABC transporter ATP-binding protein [Salinimicrobium sp. MT39]|uniref:ABC transporter ATP-binding protein n=1 Tax=Salinimicrobium profundisediminis TaxID=2994553 RepID=A0A9X3I054_9FLAO|nr:ABC transporter ATP-binding protein [Salinimicrobium profundisediminis]MCX2837486.1 ABC transporter ATP-binding protein [Salinimicrobium profundisediminis]
MSAILKAENISKQYRLGKVGTGTLGDDIKRWWYGLRGKEDPFLKVGGVNDRKAKATEDYIWALRDINFEVKQGEVLGIIGKNGAGKSTLLKLLSRVTAPTTGSIKAKGRIASLLEIGTGFHPELTGRENIFMNGAVLGMTKTEIKAKLDEIIAFSGCEMYIDTPVKRYSSGMTVRLGFAVAAHLEPEILVVDEVLAVGDAEFQKKAIGKMQDLSTGEGRTVLFVSHNMASIKTLCQRGLVLDKGMIDFSGEAIESVDHYLLNTKAIPKRENTISEDHRRQKTSKEFQIVKVRSLNENLQQDIPIIFHILIKKNSSLAVPISITGTIVNQSGFGIGSFFSDSIVVNNEEQWVDLKIPNHNLSPGEYYLNFSVANGSLKESNFIIFDQAFESIGFDVLQEKNSGIFIRWNKGWGDIHFDSKLGKYEI